MSAGKKMKGCVGEGWGAGRQQALALKCALFNFIMIIIITPWNGS